MATTPAQEEFLAITRKGQEAVIAAVKIWAETVKTTAPRLATVYAPLTDRLSGLPSFGVPFADRMPGPEETVASAYRLAEQLLAGHRKFTEDLLKAMTPLLPGRIVSAPVSLAPESTPASAAAKSTPAVTAAEEPAPAAAEEPAPAAAKEPAPAAAKEPAPAAAKSAAKSTAARPAPRSASRTAPKRTTAKSTSRSTADRPVPKGPDAS
jgi:hypothetical protein